MEMKKMGMMPHDAKIKNKKMMAMKMRLASRKNKKK